MIVLQWRDSADSFLEPETDLKKLFAAWLIPVSRNQFGPFSEYLAERLEPIAQTIAVEFEKANMLVEVVALWFVMRHSSLPYLTLDFCAKESGGDGRICYRIFRWDTLLSKMESAKEVRARVESWLARLSQEFTQSDPTLRLAIRELGHAFSRRRILPEEVQAAVAPAEGRSPRTPRGRERSVA